MSVPVTEQAVRCVLNSIIDPCSRAAGSPVGINDMGLVRSVQIDHAGTEVDLRVVVGVTEFGCMMGAAFLHDAQLRLSQEFAAARVAVELDTNFDWVPEDMSASYREQLAAKHDQWRAESGIPGARRLPLVTLPTPDRSADVPCSSSHVK